MLGRGLRLTTVLAGRAAPMAVTSMGRALAPSAVSALRIAPVRSMVTTATTTVPPVAPVVERKTPLAGVAVSGSAVRLTLRCASGSSAAAAVGVRAMSGGGHDDHGHHPTHYLQRSEVWAEHWPPAVPTARLLGSDSLTLPTASLCAVCCALCLLCAVLAGARADVQSAEAIG
jgi:hypothetical protein